MHAVSFGTDLFGCFPSGAPCSTAIGLLVACAMQIALTLTLGSFCSPLDSLQPLRFGPVASAILPGLLKCLSQETRSFQRFTLNGRQRKGVEALSRRIEVSIQPPFLPLEVELRRDFSLFRLGGDVCPRPLGFEGPGVPFQYDDPTAAFLFPGHGGMRMI